MLKNQELAPACNNVNALIFTLSDIVLQVLVKVYQVSESLGEYDLVAWGEAMLPLCVQALDGASFAALFSKMLTHERSFVRSLSAAILEQRLQGDIAADRTHVGEFLRLEEECGDIVQSFTDNIQHDGHMCTSIEPMQAVLQCVYLLARWLSGSDNAAATLRGTLADVMELFTCLVTLISARSKLAADSWGLWVDLLSDANACTIKLIIALGDEAAEVLSVCFYIAKLNSVSTQLICLFLCIFRIRSSTLQRA